MDREFIIKKLNDIIEVARDGQEGFKQAAENVHNIDLRMYFNEISLVRGKMVRDLQAQVAQLGGEPDQQGTLAGAFHRTWIELKHLVGLDDETIISSAETGEATAVKSYEEALKEPFPPALLKLLHEQYASIKATHERIKLLKDSGRYRSKTA